MLSLNEFQQLMVVMILVQSSFYIIRKRIPSTNHILKWIDWWILFSLILMISYALKTYNGSRDEWTGSWEEWVNIIMPIFAGWGYCSFIDLLAGTLGIKRKS